MGWIADSVLNFAPMAMQGTPSLIEESNVEFIKHYTGITMKKRKITDVEVDESLINSGDFIGIIRLDGLDPMLGWGMGSSTGHTTTALRIDGVLHICESQSKGSYWDTNGI